MAYKKSTVWSLQCRVRLQSLRVFAFGRLGLAVNLDVGLRLCTKSAQPHPISEPEADRGPRAGSPRGVVVATGSPLTQEDPYFLCQSDENLSAQSRIQESAGGAE